MARNEVNLVVNVQQQPNRPKFSQTDRLKYISTAQISIVRHANIISCFVLVYGPNTQLSHALFASLVRITVVGRVTLTLYVISYGFSPGQSTYSIHQETPSLHLSMTPHLVRLKLRTSENLCAAWLRKS